MLLEALRKGTPHRKRSNNDNFRCLITIWNIGIASRGLNELIFVKTSNSTKSDIFACSSKLAPNAFTLILHVL